MPDADPSGKRMKAKEAGGEPVDRPRETPWSYFCDFQDITHMVLKECHVSIHCQDNKCLVGPGAVELGWRGEMPLACDACLMIPRPHPRPAGADPAFPGCGPVLGVAGGWLLSPDRRLKPLPVPRGGSSTAGDEYPGWYPRPPAVSASGVVVWGGDRAGGAAASWTVSSRDCGV